MLSRDLLGFESAASSAKSAWPRWKSYAILSTPMQSKKRSEADGNDGLQAPSEHSPISLKALASHLNLSPATVSLVINGSPSAKSIPKGTQERILAAARKLNYRPNYMARSLRKQRSFTIGVLVPEVSEGYAALVLSGIEDHLLQEGYFYFVASHRHREDLIAEYPRLLMGRAVEGIIAVDSALNSAPPLPTVAVSGSTDVHGIAKVVVDHARAAELALEHLYELGHRDITFIKGQAFSSDTEVRWNAIREAADTLGLRIDPKRVGQLEGDSPSPELGYRVTKQLLAERHPFTALFAFNDISAIGAMHALGEAGHAVPHDVSVVGFDDIQSAAFQNPPLTTVRQPLRRMGVMAAEALLRRINGREKPRESMLIVVEPELVVRGSTAPVKKPAGARKR